MSNWEWLYQQNAKRRRQSEQQLMQQMRNEQQNIQNFLLLNSDTMSQMPNYTDPSGSYGFGEAEHLLAAYNNGDFIFNSTDDFCIEWFQYHFNTPHTPRATICSINDLNSFGVTFEGNLLNLWIGDPSIPILQVEFEEEEYTEKWMHVAISRKDNYISVYKNGVSVFKEFDNSAQIENFAVLTIGADEIDRNITLFNGLISNLRFVIGDAVYVEGSTIEYPTEPLQDIPNTKLLLIALLSKPFTDLSSYNREIKVLGTVERSPNSPFPFNPQEILPIHHILRYDINNILSYPGTGNIVYDTKTRINADLFNSPTYFSTNPKYLEFDGINQYLLTGEDMSSYFLGTEKVTLSMWIYPKDDGVILSERGQTGPLTGGWHDSQIEIVGGTAKFGMWNGASISRITSSIPTPINNWYQFVLKYDGSMMSAYINGSTAGTLILDRSTPYDNSNGLFYSIAAADTTSMGDSTYANMRLSIFDVHDLDLSYEEILTEFETSRALFGI